MVGDPTGSIDIIFYTWLYDWWVRIIFRYLICQSRSPTRKRRLFSLFISSALMCITDVHEIPIAIWRRNPSPVETKRLRTPGQLWTNEFQRSNTRIFFSKSTKPKRQKHGPINKWVNFQHFSWNQRKRKIIESKQRCISMKLPLLKKTV